MIPRTEEELELYFLLLDLDEARKHSEKSIWMHGTAILYQAAQDRYSRLRKEYLEKAKQTV